MKIISAKDTHIRSIIRREKNRQKYQLQMIASENYASSEVRNAVGSILMNKYSEGQPKKRYYQGMGNVDELELLVEQRALTAFDLDPDTWHVNVQPYSGSPANAAILMALLKPRDTILAMYLADGGHISHGWSFKGKPLSFASTFFNIDFYHVDKKTKQFDYKDIERVARKSKPNIVISGGTAYPREIDYAKMAHIAHQNNAYYLADVSHEAGLIAAGVNKSPFKHADVVMCTTHKTLRGPRGALVFAKKDLIGRIDKAVFPGLQGGPHNHTIAGIGVALKETQTAQFRSYAQKVVNNARTLAHELEKRGYDIVSGGTDKHLILVDLQPLGIAGNIPAQALEMANIICNFNTVPYDPGPPLYPSGLRLGTPALTSRGMRQKDMVTIASWIDGIIGQTLNFKLPATNRKKYIEESIIKLRSNKTIRHIAKNVARFAKSFPVPAAA